LKEAQDQVDRFIKIFLSRHKNASIVKDRYLVDVFLTDPDAYIVANYLNNKWHVSRLDRVQLNREECGVDGVLPDVESAIFFVESLIE